MKYYDLIISTKVNDNVYRLIDSKRMSKDGDLTIEEAYSILYKATLGIDASAVQASIISLMPSKDFNEDNARLLNSILSSLEYKGTRVELIEVYNANSDTLDSGILVYRNYKHSEILNNFIQANLFSYTNETTQLSKIQLDLIDSEFSNNPELYELNGINGIKLNYEASSKLGMPFSSNELTEFLKDINVNYRVYGEF